MTLTCLGQELDLDIPEDADVTVSVSSNGRFRHGNINNNEPFQAPTFLLKALSDTDITA